MEADRGPAEGVDTGPNRATRGRDRHAGRRGGPLQPSCSAANEPCGARPRPLSIAGMGSQPLPAGHRLRPPTPDDLDAIVALIEAADEADVGVSEFTRADIAHAFEAPHVDREHDLVLLTDEVAGAAAFVMLENRGDSRIEALIWLHPERRGEGLEEVVLAAAESSAARRIARVPPGEEKVFRTSIHHVADHFRPALDARGYRWVRSMWRMRIELGDDFAVDAPFPPGVEARPFRPDADWGPLHAAVTDAFREHWGFAPIPADEWRERRSGQPAHDPSLWWVAWADDEIAGFVLNGMEGQLGVVETLGVLRPWRRHGLGMALLRLAFARFREREIPSVVLYVDSENTTGATRLYERAGMAVERRYDEYRRDPASFG
jgi:mycothiol synthase